MTVAGLAAHAALGLAFLAAAVTKFASVDRFAQTLQIFRQMRSGLAGGVATGIASIELLVGALLLLGLLPRVAAAAALLLTGSIFAVAVYGVVSRSGVECRCFGSLVQTHFGISTVLRAGFMIAAATVCEVAPSAPQGPAWATGVGVVGLAAFGAAVATAARVLERLRGLAT